MKRVIINADDFGRHAAINEAVELGVMHGCLRSATVMAGGGAFEGAIDIARRHPELGLGIHFTLVDDKPVLPPSEVPSLVTPDGRFYDNHLLFVKHYLRGGVRLEEVRAELGAQLRKVERTGVPLSHADSHQHMHTLPGILRVVLDLCGQGGIKAMRAPRTPLLAGDFGGAGQLIGRLGLGTLARLAAFCAKRHHIAVPDHFGGIVAGEAVSEPFLIKTLQGLSSGTTEIMMHPGTKNAPLQEACRWQHDFEAELAAILSPKVRAVLAREKIEVVNFRALYEKTRA